MATQQASVASGSQSPPLASARQPKVAGSTFMDHRAGQSSEAEPSFVEDRGGRVRMRTAVGDILDRLSMRSSRSSRSSRCSGNSRRSSLEPTDVGPPPDAIKLKVHTSRPSEEDEVETGPDGRPLTVPITRQNAQSTAFNPFRSLERLTSAMPSVTKSRSRSMSPEMRPPIPASFLKKRGGRSVPPSCEDALGGPALPPSLQLPADMPPAQSSSDPSAPWQAMTVPVSFLPFNAFTTRRTSTGGESSSSEGICSLNPSLH